MAKVVVIAPYVPHPARHGGAIRSRVLLDALRLDHEVHLAAAVASAEDLANLNALASEIGIAVHPLPARQALRPSVVGKLGRWLFGASELIARRWQKGADKEMHRVFEKIGYDIGVIDSTFAIPVATHSCHLLFLHNLEYSMYARQDDEPRSWSDRMTRRMEARGLRSAEKSAIQLQALTVTVSEHDRDFALGLVPGAHVEVVSNSVDLHKLPLLPAADASAPPRLLFVGSLDYPPNLEAVTELVERHLPVLRKTFPKLTVRLVGKDPHGRGARFAGVEGVEVVGPVDDVVDHYRDTHAVYLPIRSGGGTRIKILEAWALGVPVLSTAVGCEGLPAEDGVQLRRFETPEQGCDALRSVLAGSASLRDKGRQLVAAQFSHAAAIARLRQLVNELVAQQAK
jgi:polysaccharide biosynthesis protein PslH